MTYELNKLNKNVTLIKSNVNIDKSKDFVYTDLTTYVGDNIDSDILKKLEEDVKDIKGWKKLKTKSADFDYEKTRKLVTIKKDVPIKYSFEDCKKNLNWNNVIPLFEEFEFASYIKKIKQGKFYK